MSLVKIYSLDDPRDNQPRYVGQTKHSLYNRLIGHLRRWKNFKEKQHAN